MDTFSGAQPVTSADLTQKKGQEYAAWAWDACRGIRELGGRFTGKANAEKLVELLGTWTHAPREWPPFVSVAFLDCAIRIDDTAQGEDRLKQIEKKRSNLCYFGIPMQIVVEPPDDVVDALRLVLATSFASNGTSKENFFRQHSTLSIGGECR